MTATRCTAQVYVKSKAFRYRIDKRQCTNKTTNPSGRCWLHEEHKASAE